MQTVWEFVGEPDRPAQLAVARRARRRGWLVTAVLALAAGIPAVIGLGPVGLFYPGLIVALGGGWTELSTFMRRRSPPDQRVTYDGALLHFEGNHELHGQTQDPQPVSGIWKLSVYPARGGYNPASNVRTDYNLVHLWLTDGTQRAFAFRPRGLEWRRCDDRRGWAVFQGTSLAAALDALLPGRWREPPLKDDAVLPVNPVLLKRWGPLPPPRG